MTEDAKKYMNGDIKESPLTYDQQVEWHFRRWKNRRRMAWFSIYALIFTVLLLFFAPVTDSRLQIIADPIAMICFVFGGVVASYMGFTTIEKWKLGK